LCFPFIITEHFVPPSVDYRSGITVVRFVSSILFCFWKNWTESLCQTQTVIATDDRDQSSYTSMIGVYVPHSPAVVECARSLWHVAVYAMAVTVAVVLGVLSDRRHVRLVTEPRSSLVIDRHDHGRRLIADHRRHCVSCQRSSSLDVVWSTARRVCSSQHSFFHDFPHVNIL